MAFNSIGVSNIFLASLALTNLVILAILYRLLRNKQ